MPRAPSNRAALWGLRVLLVLVPPILLFGIVEGITWAIGVERLADNKAFQQQEFMRDCRASADLIESRCAASNFTEPDDRISVYVFGGSSVQGYPLGETTPFSVHMQNLLDRRFPGRYVVHNLGIACRDSIFIRKCAAQVGANNSDLYVIYAGHNDYANFMVPRPRLRIFSEEHPGLFEFESLLARSRVYSLLIDLTQGKPRQKMASWTRLPEAEFQAAKRITLEEYTRNLKTVIAQAAELGIEVVLVTVVSNITDYPTPREKWAALKARERPFPEQFHAWHGHYIAGIEAFEEARFRESLAAFRRAKDSAMGGRAHSDLNERVRQLARSHSHVHLVDFEQTLDRVGVDEGHGCDFFGTEDWCDQFHPNPRTLKMLANDVVQELIRIRPPVSRRPKRTRPQRSPRPDDDLR